MGLFGNALAALGLLIPVVICWGATRDSDSFPTIPYERDAKPRCVGLSEDVDVFNVPIAEPRFWRGHKFIESIFNTRSENTINVGYKGAVVYGDVALWRGVRDYDAEVADDSGGLSKIRPTDQNAYGINRPQWSRIVFQRYAGKHPRALRVFSYFNTFQSQFGRKLCGFVPVGSRADSGARLFQSFPNKVDADASYEDGAARGYEHPQGPKRHVLLSLQILVGGLLAGVGFKLLGYARAKGRDLTIFAGLCCFLGGLAAIIGGVALITGIPLLYLGVLV